MNGALLHLINVQYEDEGSYECEALNVKGKDWHRQWLYVEGNGNGRQPHGITALAMNCFSHIELVAQSIETKVNLNVSMTLSD